MSTVRLSLGSYLHFDIGVRVAVSIHGRQVNAAYDAHDEVVGLGAVHQGYQNPAPLLLLAPVLPSLTEGRGVVRLSSESGQTRQQTNTNYLVFVESDPSGAPCCCTSLCLQRG